MRSLAALLAVAALVLTAGCGSGEEKPQVAKPGDAFPAPDSATVQGRLLADGGPRAGSKPTPLTRGTITLTGADGSRIRGQVDAEGHYAIGVSPGTYRVSARSAFYEGGRTDCLPGKQPGTLAKGSTTTVDVYCLER